MHARHGAIENAFAYPVDYILIDPEGQSDLRLFSRDRLNVFSYREADHGPLGGCESLPEWIRSQFVANGLEAEFELRLMTQPRVFGTLFNPVSFWFAMHGDAILAFIAEVNNTFKQRHFYLCHHDDFRPILPAEPLVAKKVFYVSPFQEIQGEYRFQIALKPDTYGIRIDFQDDADGVLATVYGKREVMTDARILRTAMLRPLGGMRVFGLIFYQAMKLKIKGARYRVRPKPPAEEVSS